MLSVSVIIPTYESSATIERALLSVINQSESVLEILVVDDGSLDYEVTESICSRYNKICNIKFYRNKHNSGPSVTRNLGVSKSSGDYLAFLDSDDIWHHEKIRIQVGIMIEKKSIFSCHGYLEDVSGFADKFLITEISESSIKNFTYKKLLFKSFVATPTVVVGRTAFKKFDVNYKRAEDWKCWLEILSSSNTGALYVMSDLAAGFKPIYGSSGLSKNMGLMHKSICLVLSDLFKNKNLSFGYYVTSLFFEYIKYIIRRIKKQSIKWS